MFNGEKSKPLAALTKAGGYVKIKASLGKISVKLKGLSRMYAIIRSGNKQFRVEENREIRVPRLELEEGAAFESPVLLLEVDGDVKVGTPFVEGAKAVGKVVRHGKGRKLRVFKYKAKKNYRRRYGSREHYTAVRIEQIVTA